MVTADEVTVVAKALLDPIMVEDGQGDGGLADSASTDEGDWIKVLNKMDYLLDQLVASEEGSRWQRRGLSGYAMFKCKIMGPSIVSISNLV